MTHIMEQNNLLETRVRTQEDHMANATPLELLNSVCEVLSKFRAYDGDWEVALRSVRNKCMMLLRVWMPLLSCPTLRRSEGDKLRLIYKGLRLILYEAVRRVIRDAEERLRSAYAAVMMVLRGGVEAPE